MTIRTIYHSNGAKTEIRHGAGEDFGKLIAVTAFPGASAGKETFFSMPIMLVGIGIDGAYLISQLDREFIESLSAQDIEYYINDYLERHMTPIGDPLSTPAIEAPITQERIEMAFGRDPDGVQAMAQILKKAKRHL